MANQNQFWLRTLNVRQEEQWLVKKLFMLQFLQGSGLAFFFTAVFALFLDRFPITELPYVFIFSALLLWVTGFIYSKAEQRYSGIKFALGVSIFMALSILFFRLAFINFKSDYFLYWMLAWFNVLYLLNNLEFWGLASLLFNARQSKRLFGVISAGDIPAKFIGYTLALFIVEYIGTINLLWMGVGCMVLSIPFLLTIHRSGKLPEQHHNHKQDVQAPSMKKLVQNITANSLTRSLAILTVILSSSFILINFSFYAGVKSAYTNEIALAKFIAFFLAFVRIIALIIKLIFTSRLINKLGIINSLLITPVVMLIMLIAIVTTQNMDNYQKLILYLFGVTSIVVDILRSAINSPVFLTIMQPLPIHERLRAHTIVKGLMDPFASMFSGIILLVFIYIEKELNLLTLAYLLIVLGIFWIIGIYKLNQQYLRTIIKTISGRYFNTGNYVLEDSNTFSLLKEKLRIGSETESMNILSMMNHANTETRIEMMKLALQHDSDKVKVMALNLIESQDITVPVNSIVPFLNSSNRELVAATIRVLCKFKVSDHLISPFENHTDIVIRKGALSGILRYGDHHQKQRVHAILNKLVNSDIIMNRILTAEILLEQGGNDYDKIGQLMNDESPAVRKAAYYAAALSESKELLMQLVSRMQSQEKDIIYPLYTAGESALSVIHTAITASHTSPQQSEKLILVCGRIGGVKSHTLLLTLLNTRPGQLQPIVKALYRSHFVPRNKQVEVFISLIGKLLAHSAGIVYMQTNLDRWGKKYELLINSFQLELNELRETLLYIFALLYNRENINKVRSAYLSGKRELIINAMEIIDITVRKDLAAHFNTLFEPGNNLDRMDSLRKIYPASFLANIEEVLEKILAEEKKPFHNWTKACSLYTSKKQSHNINSLLIQKYTKVENQLLRETAEYAC